MDLSDEHLEKQLSGRILTNLWISIDWSFKHFEKHSFPIDSICSWKIMNEKD
jgi:hypothetical protein